MEAAKKEDKKNSSLRISFSIVFILGGALLIVLTEGEVGKFISLFQKVGLAFIVAGIASLFKELVLNRWPSPTTKIPDLISSLNQTGMKMICFPRKSFWRYHSWYLVNDPQDIFFAGRSVLHRIENDFEIRKFRPLEDAIIRKLEEGSKIKILFTNPTWSVIPDLAKAEAQSEKALYTDLATSMGIVHRLWEKLEKESLPGELEISLYEEHLQYAYHRINNIRTNEKEMLVGFYFSQRLGCRSPLFDVLDEAIQLEFENHFITVFANAMKLLDYPAYGKGKNFNQQLFLKAENHLINILGQNPVSQLMH